MPAGVSPPNGTDAKHYACGGFPAKRHRCKAQLLQALPAPPLTYRKRCDKMNLNKNTKGAACAVTDDMIYRSIEELIGGTPLYIPERFLKEQSCDCTLLAKAEFFNPAGSTKDRAALSMINEAERRGELTPSGAVIEPTSGNTGIALAAICAARGYRAVIVMPDSMSVERQRLMKAYGAELILTPGEQGMKGAIEKAKEIQSTLPGSIIAGQFENPANPDAHYRTTAPELWRDSEGNIDIFIACVGTGGTFSGCAKYLKERDPRVLTVAIEPESSPLITRGISAAHKIQGIGANFIPENYDPSLADKVITVSDAEAYEAGRAFARSEGLLVGISSGACLAGVVKLCREGIARGKRVAAILPDTGERYLTTPDYLVKEKED